MTEITEIIFFFSFLGNNEAEAKTFFFFSQNSEFSGSKGPYVQLADKKRQESQDIIFNISMNIKS